MSDFRATLNDKMISRLAPADEGQYLVRDTDLKGFFLVVGKRKMTFTVQSEFWEGGKRRTKKVAIGSVDELSTREARTKAKDELAKIGRGEYAAEAAAAAKAKAAAGLAIQKAGDITLRSAWARYKVFLERKDRSAATIAGYGDHVERLMKDWLDVPLMTLCDNPRMVSDRHDQLTKDCGPYGANGCMRTLRAIYNHARRSARELPPDNPTSAVDWNDEKRRDTAMGAFDLPAWIEQVARLRHPIRREFHLFTLLSGSRPTALRQAEVAHFSFARRVLHIPRPKGGAKRAFDIPLSREMIRCLVRAMRASRMLHAENAERWIFAAGSQEGHLVEHKEDRDRLSKWGNDLRQSYRTLGQAAGLSEIDMHLLMNHRLPDVNAGYITRDKLMGDHLRAAQQKLSSYIVSAGAAAHKDGKPRERVWPKLASRRIGDEAFDPTPPDPRIGKPLGPRKQKSASLPAPAEAT
ncbi:MAG: integrase [Caulobacteraceae bacterium]|nr:integrase [Caulobacteraceae bacterium]